MKCHCVLHEQPEELQPCCSAPAIYAGWFDDEDPGFMWFVEGCSMCFDMRAYKRRKIVIDG